MTTKGLYYKIALLILTINFTKACSVTPDFNFPTLAEQNKLASAVIRGTVSQTFGNINEGSINLQVSEYIKGCGSHGEIRVNGFTNSAMCGVSTPSVGAEVVVFVCRSSSDLSVWKLNKYTLFTGAYTIRSKDIPEDPKRWQEVANLRKQIKDRYGCTSCCKSGLPTCLRRDGTSNNPDFNNNNNGGGSPPILLPPVRPPSVPSFPVDPNSPIAPEVPSIPNIYSDENIQRLKENLRNRVQQQFENIWRNSQSQH